MKAENTANKTKDELINMHNELKAKLMKLGFDLAGSKLKDISQIKKTKKDIARILTVLNNLNK